MVTKDANNYYNIDIEVDDVTTVDIGLEIQAKIVYIARAVNETSSDDKTSWPAPQDPITATLTGNGVIGSLCFNTTRFFSVHLDVYAVASTAACSILDGLGALMESGSLADVDLIVEGKGFPAHKAVLAAASPVFHRMFTGDFKEGKDGKVEVEVSVFALTWIFRAADNSCSRMTRERGAPRDGYTSGTSLIFKKLTKPSDNTQRSTSIYGQDFRNKFPPELEH